MDKLSGHQEASESDNYYSLKSRSNALVFNTKANAFKNLGQHAEALENYDRYLALTPNDAEALANRGWVLDKLKRYKEAIESYSRSLALTKLSWNLDAPTFNNRANAFKNLGIYGGALIDYDTYLDIQPNDADAQANRGWVANQLKDYQKALTSYNHSLKLRPNHVPTLHNRSETFKNLGHFVEAMSDCKLCLKLDPHYAPALANRPKILRGLASKGHQKDKEEVYFFSKAHVKIIEILYNIIVRPISYVSSYLVMPIRKTKTLSSSLENIVTSEGQQTTRGGLGFSQETRNSSIESSLETSSIKEIKSKKHPNRKSESKKSKRSEKIITDPLIQEAVNSHEINQGLLEATSYAEPLISASILPFNSNLKTTNIQSVAPWPRRLIASMSTFFQYYIGLLYMNFIVKIFAFFKTFNSDVVVTAIQAPENKEKKSTQLENSENENDYKHQEASDQLLEEPGFDEKLASETGEKISEIEVRLKEQEKSMLFMKNPFHKLQVKPEPTKIVEQVEQLQTMQEFLKKDIPLKEISEEQLQKAQFSDSEMTKNTQKKSLVAPQPVSMIGEVNQLKDPLKQQRSLYHSNQSQPPSSSISQNILPIQNSSVTPFEIQIPPALLFANHSVVNMSEVYIQLPTFISKMMVSFEEENYCVMIVGSAVRDFLTGKMPTNIDIITNMPPSLLLFHFNEYSIQAVHYSKFYQISLPGLKIDIFYRDTAVFLSNSVFIHQAEAQIFTINALYCDCQGRVYDPLQTGLLDLLNRRMLRLVNIKNSYFEQDPFLLLRGVKLAVQYGLTIPPETGQVIKHFSPLLENNDQQRLYVELEGLFLRGYALKSFEKLMKVGLLKPIFPKAVEFLLNDQGQDYQTWLQLELRKIDQLVIEHTSINYIYAIFLTGNVIAVLEQPSCSSKVNQSIDKAIIETFQNQSNTKSLEEIKQMMLICVEEMLLSKSKKPAQISSELISKELSLAVSDRLSDTLESYKTGWDKNHVSRIF